MVVRTFKKKKKKKFSLLATIKNAPFPYALSGSHFTQVLLTGKREYIYTGDLLDEIKSHFLIMPNNKQVDEWPKKLFIGHHLFKLVRAETVGPVDYADDRTKITYTEEATYKPVVEPTPEVKEDDVRIVT